MAAKKRKTDNPRATVGLHGFYRVAIVNEDGTIAADTGPQHNLIVSGGLTNYLTYVFASVYSWNFIGHAVT